LRQNGTIWAWGNGGSGILGLGNTSNVSKPTQIGTDENWNSCKISGSFAAASKSNGTLWTWGNGVDGALGRNNNLSYSVPVQLGANTDWTPKISIHNHAMAIKSDGTLWGWGQNADGQLGLGDKDKRSSPVQVGVAADWISVDVFSHTLAIRSSSGSTGATSGTLWAWGRNTFGRLGLGNTTYRSSPVQIGSDNTWKKVFASTHSLALKTNGTLWAWGRNNYGQLGLGNTTYRSSPAQIGANTDWIDISGGYEHSIAIKSDGTLWGWGFNHGDSASSSNRMVLGLPAGILSPILFAGSGWTSVNTSYSGNVGVKTNGTLWSWGRNTFGELGLGDTDNRSSPVQIGSATDWTIPISADQSGAGLKSGKIYTWGRNSYGQLGLGNTTNRSSPVQVGTGTDWANIYAGNGWFVAKKTNSSIWSWGLNATGTLAQGNTTNRSSPVQIGGDTDWQKIKTFRHALAIKSNGTLWAWGKNTNRESGIPTIFTNISSPVQVGSDTDWAEVSSGDNCSLAIRTNGTLWAWGQNTYGKLGNSSTTEQTSPIQIGNSTDWSKVFAGGLSVCMALKTNGTLWAWGRNTYGQLGQGDMLDRSSPVQIGSDSNWVDVSNLGYHVFAKKSDGSIWCWGRRKLSVLGILHPVRIFSSPVQISGMTGWTAGLTGWSSLPHAKTIGGNRHFAAIRKI
jgi:alpha-tubulin suppressor-like RCC1 family protein